MARDVMTIRLQLRRIRVVDVLVDTISRLVVEVESTWSVSRLSVVRVQDQVGA